MPLQRSFPDGAERRRRREGRPGRPTVSVMARPIRYSGSTAFTRILSNSTPPWLPSGLRKQYAPSYYAAFVLDPDGNNIEAVYRGA